MGFFDMSATISDLTGLAEKWEGIRGIRAKLQHSDWIVVPAPGRNTVEITAPCASENEAIMQPLLPYLITEDGLGMVSIPALEGESFGSGLIKVWFDV